MAIKIDMKKTFDYMEWNFSLIVLKYLGFHAKWIMWIQECIATVSLSIVINGKPIGNFNPLEV